ncbi:AKR1A1 [Branchiostoma lanceolatum]|uniref:AKR1A1 protein n=1 Tax=Branchiostoma lanceolatum TaxID=7740 RepID=A0A8J9W2L1_BRALA|nr:AKR1A1 [Branchiostoma lanceolatum]
MDTVKLNTGSDMPIVGLGTFKLRGQELVVQTVETALKLGYRSIDTAAVYRNEKDIAIALKQFCPKYDIERNNLFITSKLAPKDQGYEEAKAAVLKSLEALGLEYLDLYLVHWPGKQGMLREDERNRQYRKDTWRALEELHQDGKLRAVGVSNYTVRHMKELLEHCQVTPAVLQIEHHPELQQTELISLCREQGIHFQAYSSLGTGKLVSHPTVLETATKYSRTPGQILLRWAVQRGVGVIPKSTNPQHLKDNIHIFDFTLEEEYMGRLDSLDSGMHYCWDPQHVA